MAWLISPYTAARGYGNPFNRPFNLVRDEYGNVIGASYEPTARQIAARGGAAYSGPGATIVREPVPAPVLSPPAPIPKKIEKTRQDRKKWERYRRTNRRGLGDGDLPRFIPTNTSGEENNRTADSKELSATEIAALAIAFGALLFWGK
jgi:hypothetical protein